MRKVNTYNFLILSILFFMLFSGCEQMNISDQTDYVDTLDVKQKTMAVSDEYLMNTAINEGLMDAIEVNDAFKNNGPFWVMDHPDIICGATVTVYPKVGNNSPVTIQYKDTICNTKSRKGRIELLIPDNPPPPEPAATYFSAVFNGFSYTANENTVLISGSNTTKKVAEKVDEFTVGIRSLFNASVNGSGAITRKDNYKLTISKNNPPQIQMEGDSLLGSRAGAAYSCTNRFGLTDTVSVSTAMIFNYCNGINAIPVSGICTEYSAGSTVAITYGVGNDKAILNNCSAYGYSMIWTKKDYKPVNIIVEYVK